MYGPGLFQDPRCTARNHTAHIQRKRAGAPAWDGHGDPHGNENTRHCLDTRHGDAHTGGGGRAPLRLQLRRRLTHTGRDPNVAHVRPHPRRQLPWYAVPRHVAHTLGKIQWRDKAPAPSIRHHTGCSGHSGSHTVASYARCEPNNTAGGFSLSDSGSAEHFGDDAEEAGVLNVLDPSRPPRAPPAPQRRSRESILRVWICRT